MWVLWLILTWPSIPGEHALKPIHETYAECIKERDRMTQEFVIAYPGDRDYLFECRFSKRVM